ncbi:MAG: AAA family ATPase [Desulfobacterales bacterium]
MYLRHYQLQRKPFQITADPAFMWLGEKHGEALATLKYGIQENKGFLLLTGDVGTGKTALIKMLLQKIDVSALVATVPDPGMEALDFFNFLADEFGMKRRFASKGEFLIEFKRLLLSAHAANRQVLLIVDEAQRLSLDMLEQVRLLSNIELENRKLINIFFVGQTEFNRTLLDESVRAVRQRITVSYHIEPLAEKETAQYIEHRLKIAGARQAIFTPQAIRRVHAFSGGNPRLINILCDHALLTGYARGVRTIDPAILQECERELRLPEMRASEFKEKTESGFIRPAADRETSPAEQAPEGPPAWRVPALLVALLLTAFAGIVLYQYRSDSPRRWATEEIAPQSYPAAALRREAAQEPAAPPGSPPAAAPTAPMIAAAGEGSPPREVSREALRTNPFAQGKVILFFPHNSNELRKDVLEGLEEIAKYLKAEKNLKVRITGYTDNVGPLTYNLSVSQFRANSVRSYLAGKGIDPERLIAVGLGPKDPIASNDTPEGRERNRRVEIEPIRD